MKELGEFLKRARVSKGVSLTEACEDLDFSTSRLENIESGNVRAFKDVYELRDNIKTYARYLGLNPDKVVDEFNGFLFQHTSKISLDDIREAQKKKDEEAEEKRIKSPYTIPHKKKKNLWPIFYIGIGTVILLVIIYLIIKSINQVPERTNELSSYREEYNFYEFTKQDYNC